MKFLLISKRFGYLLYPLEKKGGSPKISFPVSYVHRQTLDKTLLCAKKTGGRQTNERAYKSSREKDRAKSERGSVSIVQICLRPRFEDQGPALAIFEQRDRSIIRRFIRFAGSNPPAGLSASSNYARKRD